MNMFSLRVWTAGLQVLSDMLYFCNFKLNLSSLIGQDRTKLWISNWLNEFCKRSEELGWWVGLQACKCCAMWCCMQLDTSGMWEEAAPGLALCWLGSVTKVRRGTANKMQPSNILLASLWEFIKAARGVKGKKFDTKVWFHWNAVIVWKSLELQAFDLVSLLGASCSEARERK